MEINLKPIAGKNIAISCPTKEDAIQFSKVCKDNLINGFSPREIKNLSLEVLVTLIEENKNMVSKDVIRKVFQNNKYEKDYASKKELPQKVKLTSETFDKKIQEGIESGNYVAYKASDLYNH